MTDGNFDPFSVMKQTPRTMVKAWLERGRVVGASHVVVKVDLFSLEAYPVMVKNREGALSVARDESDHTKAIEVYDLANDLDAQLAEHRAWNV